jgi:hypothetical protein
VAGPGAVAAGPGTISRRPDWPSRPGAGYIMMVGRGLDPPGSVTRRTDRGRRDSLLEAAWSRQFIYVYSFMRIRHLGFFLIDLFSDYKTDRQTDIHCCRKGPLIIIKFPSLLLVRFRAARACLSVTVTQDDGPPSVTWQPGRRDRPGSTGMDQ